MVARKLRAEKERGTEKASLRLQHSSQDYKDLKLQNKKYNRRDSTFNYISENKDRFNIQFHI